MTRLSGILLPLIAAFVIDLHTCAAQDFVLGIREGCNTCGNAEDTADVKLFVFRADSLKDTGLAVVICPGKGKRELPAAGYSGRQVARWFAESGITAALIGYSMPERDLEILSKDAAMALRIMGGLEAGATGFTPEKVGIADCSANGKIADSASALCGFSPAFSVIFKPKR